MTALHRSSLPCSLFRLSLPALLIAGACHAAPDEIIVTATPVTINPLESNGTYRATHSDSATKTATPLNKVPSSVSVISEEEVTARGASTLKQALGYTPGVVTGTSGSSSVFDSVMMRGFHNVSQNIYLDGLKVQGDMYAESRMLPEFMQRIDVMKGPASVLYGQSNPGGVVLMTSKRPQMTPLREVRLQAGNHHLWQTGFDFSDALNDDETQAYRLTGTIHDQHQQQQGERERYYALQGSYLWQPDDATSLLLTAQAMNAPRNGYYGWLPREGTVDSGATGKLSTGFNEGEPGYNRFERQQRLFGWQFDHAFNENWSFHQGLRYQHISTNWRTIYGSGLCSSNPMACYGVPQQDLSSTLARSHIRNDERLSGLVTDTHAIHNISGNGWKNTLMLGIDYSQLRNRMSNEMDMAAPLDLRAPQYGNLTTYPLPFPQTHTSTVNKNHQTGLYLQEQLFSQDWTLTLGGRYDENVSKSRSHDNMSGENSSHHQTDREFTWRGGINYQLPYGFAPYFSYSESFEPSTAATVSGKPLDPSRGKQYEAGLKYLPDDSALSATLALYELTKDNNLHRDPLNPFFSVQGGEIRSRGIELETKAALTYNWNLIAGYAYTDTRFRQQQENANNHPAMVPMHTASLWTDYTFDNAPLNGVTVGGGVRYNGKTQGDDANSFTVPAYTVADLMLRYKLDNLPAVDDAEIALNINNLFNKHYVASCFTDAACSWGNDRQITTTLTVHW